MGKLFFAKRPAETLAECWRSHEVWNRSQETSSRFLDILSRAEKQLGVSAGFIPMDGSPDGYLQGGDSYAIPSDHFPIWLDRAVSGDALSLDDSALRQADDWLVQAAVLCFRLSGAWPTYIADDPQRFSEEALAQELRGLPS